MIDQMTLQTIGILLTALTVSIAAIYYSMTLRYTRRSQELQLETRQAQLFMQIYNRQYDIEQRKSLHIIDSLEVEGLEDFYEKYGPDNNPDAYFRIQSLGAYFEGVGVLVKRNLVDPTMVDDLMSGRIIDFWDALGGFMYEYREKAGDYEAWEHVEYLYNVIKSIQDKQRIEAGLPTR